MKLHPTIAALHADILDYLAKSGMYRTDFGKAAVHDPSFLPRLEAGRMISFKTIDRVRAFLDYDGWRDRKGNPASPEMQIALTQDMYMREIHGPEWG